MQVVMGRVHTIVLNFAYCTKCFRREHDRNYHSVNSAISYHHFLVFGLNLENWAVVLTHIPDQ